jgi:hypothetical protein
MVDMAEIYRQDYMDARDMVRDLTYENDQLRNEIELLKNRLKIAENHILDSEFNWYQLEMKSFEAEYFDKKI